MSRDSHSQVEFASKTTDKSVLAVAHSVDANSNTEEEPIVEVLHEELQHSIGPRMEELWTQTTPSERLVEDSTSFKHVTQTQKSQCAPKVASKTEQTLPNPVQLNGTTQTDETYARTLEFESQYEPASAPMTSTSSQFKPKSRDSCHQITSTVASTERACEADLVHRDQCITASSHVYTPNTSLSVSCSTCNADKACQQTPRKNATSNISTITEPKSKQTIKDILVSSQPNIRNSGMQTIEKEEERQVETSSGYCTHSMSQSSSPKRPGTEDRATQPVATVDFVDCSSVVLQSTAEKLIQRRILTKGVAAQTEEYKPRVNCKCQTVGLKLEDVGTEVTTITEQSNAIEAVSTYANAVADRAIMTSGKQQTKHVAIEAKLSTPVHDRACESPLIPIRDQAHQTHVSEKLVESYSHHGTHDINTVASQCKPRSRDSHCQVAITFGQKDEGVQTPDKTCHDSANQMDVVETKSVMTKTEPASKIIDMQSSAFVYRQEIALETKTAYSSGGTQTDLLESTDDDCQTEFETVRRSQAEQTEIKSVKNSAIQTETICTEVAKGLDVPVQTDQFVQTVDCYTTTLTTINEMTSQTGLKTLESTDDGCQTETVRRSQAEQTEIKSVKNSAIQSVSLEIKDMESCAIRRTEEIALETKFQAEFVTGFSSRKQSIDVQHRNTQTTSKSHKNSAIQSEAIETCVAEKSVLAATTLQDLSTGTEVEQRENLLVQTDPL
ncbi:hypothetical protein Ciccas_010773, partial [Cichlidogyrus casuarinus]